MNTRTSHYLFSPASMSDVISAIKAMKRKNDDQSFSEDCLSTANAVMQKILIKKINSATKKIVSFYEEGQIRNAHGKMVFYSLVCAKKEVIVKKINSLLVETFYAYIKQKFNININQTLLKTDFFGGKIESICSNDNTIQQTKTNPCINKMILLYKSLVIVKQEGKKSRTELSNYEILTDYILNEIYLINLVEKDKKKKLIFLVHMEEFLNQFSENLNRILSNQENKKSTTELPELAPSKKPSLAS